ncbi:hypothetical protein OXYTRIMIC_152 [Oxytricha trifallax]|uniref:Uncharacterized protein n=1 Tax=Oxytricha trifallax TaxID=1172189 RepID=A0A073HYV4_9SPIT|nr:hypothetical protein OXYTRIMIC_152 [Oxytricha trifallax]
MISQWWPPLIVFYSQLTFLDQHQQHEQEEAASAMIQLRSLAQQRIQSIIRSRDSSRLNQNQSKQFPIIFFLHFISCQFLLQGSRLEREVGWNSPQRDKLRDLNFTRYGTPIYELRHPIYELRHPIYALRHSLFALRHPLYALRHF